MNTDHFYWAIQQAVFFVDYAEDQDSFVGAKKLTDFYSVIFLFIFFIFIFFTICASFFILFFAGQLTTLHNKAP